MKKITLLNVTILFFLLTSLSSADTSQRKIILKDGSLIIGTVTKMENGVYTVVSEHLGEMQINDQDIANIQSGNDNVLVNDTSSNNENTQSSNLKTQVQAMQGTILSDPEMMKDIMGLMDDPEIQTLLTDKAFVSDVTSMDQNKMQNNDKIQALMNNPKMKKLMEKAQSRMTASPTAQP